jgi:hypothetical protein
MMRVLTGMSLFTESTDRQYIASPLAKYYTSSSPFSAAVIHITSELQVLYRLSDYFQEKGYNNPDDAYNGPFQYARNTPLHCFE